MWTIAQKGRGWEKKDKWRVIRDEKGGEKVVGISRPVSPPPHSPLPPWPMVYLSYKCHLYSLKIMRDKAKLSSSHSQNCPKKQLATSIPPLIINRFLWTLWWYYSLDLPKFCLIFQIQCMWHKQLREKLNISWTHHFGGSGAHLIKVATGLFLVYILIVGHFAWSKNSNDLHSFKFLTALPSYRVNIKDLYL